MWLFIHSVLILATTESDFALDLTMNELSNNNETLNETSLDTSMEQNALESTVQMETGNTIF